MAILSIALALVGLVGVIVPFLPGAGLAWLGLFLYAIYSSFENISALTVIIFLIFTVGTMFLDYAAPLIGAQRYKASRNGIVGSIIGMLLGVISLGPLGLVIGPFVGAFVGELTTGKSHPEALKPALGTVVGFLASTLIKFILTLVMFGFLLAAIF